MPTTTSRLAVRSPPSRSPGPPRSPGPWASPLLNSKPFRDNEVDSRDGGAQRFSQLQLNSRGDRNRKPTENGPKPIHCPRSKIVQPTNAQPGAYTTVCVKHPQPTSRTIAQAAPKKAEPPPYEPTPIFPKELFPDVVHKVFGEDLDIVLLHFQRYYSKTVKDFSLSDWQELCQFLDEEFTFSYLEWEYCTDTQVLMVVSLSHNHQEMVSLRNAHIEDALDIICQVPSILKKIMAPKVVFGGDTTQLYSDAKSHNVLMQKVPDVLTTLRTRLTDDLVSLDKIMFSQPDYTPEPRPCKATAAATAAQADGSGMMNVKRPTSEGGFTKTLTYIKDRATAMREGRTTPLEKLCSVNIIALRETFESSLAKPYRSPAGKSKESAQYRNASLCKGENMELDDAMFRRMQTDHQLDKHSFDYSKHLIQGAGPWVCKAEGHSYIWHGAMRAYWVHVNIADDDQVQNFTELVERKADMVEYLEAGLGIALLNEYEGADQERRDVFLGNVACDYQRQLDCLSETFQDLFFEKAFEEVARLPSQEDLDVLHAHIEDSDVAKPISHSDTQEGALEEIEQYWKAIRGHAAQPIDLRINMHKMLQRMVEKLQTSSKSTAQWRIEKHIGEVQEAVVQAARPSARPRSPFEDQFARARQALKRKRGTSNAAADDERRAGPSAGPHAVD
ncbi:hypothetical protein EVJ58_g898 [Rhodofomes roseus]|uniref:Uncharacterized protein n=1 Tax=Rhodofomes roseus TaxID=34475 RepID=A0A4Y9Z471_9APHY|nr:hypothetical protein EVJ58_g898 [Rhodofomes roseus]